MTPEMYNIKKDEWIRPWNIEKFDTLYERDDRFFAILMKGVLTWLNEHILLYNKPIRHFIYNTGSAYLYVEKNGYEFSVNETTGEDMIYMELPRCIVELSSINVPFEELTSPFVHGTYERRVGNEIKSFNAEMRRMPIEWSLNLHYYFSNFNESIVLVQELIDRLCFQQYFNIVYLGKIIECSIELPADFSIELNQIDMTNPDPQQKSLTLAIKICTNYPIINERSEIDTANVISTFGTNMQLFNDDTDNVMDNETAYTQPVSRLGKLKRFSNN